MCGGTSFSSILHFTADSRDKWRKKAWPPHKEKALGTRHGHIWHFPSWPVWIACRALPHPAHFTTSSSLLNTHLISILNVWTDTNFPQMSSEYQGLPEREVNFLYCHFVCPQTTVNVCMWELGLLINIIMRQTKFLGEGRRRALQHDDFELILLLYNTQILI